MAGGGFTGAVKSDARARLPRRILVALTGVLTLASGLLILRMLAEHGGRSRVAQLLDYSPFEFRHLSRFAALLLGFGLSVSSVNLLRRKRRAFHAVLILAALSAVLHLLHGPDYLHAALAAVLLGLLYLGRHEYTVGSGLPSWRPVLLPVAVGLAFSLIYSIAGFWWLDERHFGMNFDLGTSARHALAALAFVPAADLLPRTHHALWFIDSLHLITFALLAWTALQLYQPAVYRFRTHPHERHQVEAIVQAHGRSALDYFKFWPDKSYFFSASGKSVIAFRESGGFAVALGDPVGPEAEIASITREFLDFCHSNDWGVAFYQALPDFLPIYRTLGLKRLKIGDEAIVDLAAFSLDGKSKKSLRHTLNLLETSGVACSLAEPPLAPALIARAREVSEAWLTISGRRERGFTLGFFDDAYLHDTPLLCIEDQDARLLAFANLIPSFAPGESTIDLMRHRPDAPNGTMDFLFMKLFFLLRERGSLRFNLGMAPMSGFGEKEAATAEERAVHLFFQHLNFLFSYRGLRAYKAKFASSWEPRYAVYRRTLDLPRLAIALERVSSIRDRSR